MKQNKMTILPTFTGYIIFFGVGELTICSKVSREIPNNRFVAVYKLKVGEYKDYPHFPLE